MNNLIEPLEQRVINFTDDDIHYPFQSDPCIYPPKRQYKYPSSLYLDTFPCYSHSLDVVYNTAFKIEKDFPIGAPPAYYLLPRDQKGFTNGYATSHEIWAENDKEEHGWIETQVVLAGKRIPLHPAMTRYFTSHEYGHCVHYWIEFIQGRKDDEEGFNPFEREYAKIRNIIPSKEYGGRRWHKAIGEIIVNDFRVIMTNTENEFWPHDVEHPLKCQPIIDHWNDLKAKYAYHAETFDLAKMRAQ